MRFLFKHPDITVGENNRRKEFSQDVKKEVIYMERKTYIICWKGHFIKSVVSTIFLYFFINS